jgi:hypothetical protein
MNNELRYGRFTSSEIYKLTKKGKAKDELFGDPAKKYIASRGFERKLKRSLNSSSSPRPLQWGKCVEQVCFDMLPTDYVLQSNETIVHSEFPFIAGTPDAIRFKPKKIVGDIKCPETLESFCTLIEAYNQGGFDMVREKHSDGEKFYWQLVNNAILTNSDSAELIVFAPSDEHYESVVSEAQLWGFNWIGSAPKSDLPFLPSDSEYKSLNILSVEIPQADRDRLIYLACQAESMIPTPQILTIHDKDVTVFDNLPG